MHSNRTEDRSIIYTYLRSLQKQFDKNRQVMNFEASCSTFFGLHNSVNLSRGRSVTNVGRTCGPTPLLVLLVILSCNKICLYLQTSSVLFTKNKFDTCNQNFSIKFMS